MSEFRLVEKKSVFVGILMPLDLEEDFRAAFLEVKEKHPQATHITFACKVGAFERSSDAKEPAHVAGSQILQEILKAELDHVALFVVRYFGGVKLGKVGLRDAYRKCSRGTIESAKLGAKKRKTKVLVDAVVGAKFSQKFELLGGKVEFGKEKCAILFDCGIEKAKELLLPFVCDKEFCTVEVFEWE